MRDNNIQASDNTIENTLKKSFPYVRQLQREIFYLWIFLAHEDLMDEAVEFMETYMDKPTPYERCLIV